MFSDNDLHDIFKYAINSKFENLKSGLPKFYGRGYLHKGILHTNIDFRVRNKNLYFFNMI